MLIGSFKYLYTRSMWDDDPNRLSIFVNGQGKSSDVKCIMQCLVYSPGTHQASPAAPAVPRPAVLPAVASPSELTSLSWQAPVLNPADKTLVLRPNDESIIVYQEQTMRRMCEKCEHFSVRIVMVKSAGELARKTTKLCLTDRLGVKPAKRGSNQQQMGC